MRELQLVDNPRTMIYRTTWRDMVGVFFRRKKLIFGTFLVVFAAALAFALFWPPTYESESKILVTQARQDPVISADPKDQLVMKNGVTVDDVNSEIELLDSYDLLQNVVLKTGLDKMPPSIPRRIINLFSPDNNQERIAHAVDHFQKELTIAPVTDSNLIRVTYDSPDPQLSEKVMKALTDGYLEKHLTVHRPGGVFDFFEKESARYRDELAAAQKKLAEFTNNVDTVSATTERDASLQKAIEMEATLRTTRADIKQTKDRISSLRQQIDSVPSRMTTSDRNSDTLLLGQLKGNLVALELKRTELLTKYQPTYPAVVEIDKQIAQAKEAIATDEQTPIREVTTDRNPTSQLLHDDLAKSEADLAALQAKEAAVSRIVQRYRDEASRFFTNGIAQQNLQRDVKLAEDNYLLYATRREEARIGDALDTRKMANVAIAEPATFPVLPLFSVPLLIAAGFLLASVAALSAGIAAHYIDTSLHSPKDVEAYLEVPVLAALPQTKG